MANDVLRAYRLGETIEGNPVQWADSPQLAQAMARMRQALAEYRNAANADPIERLIRLRGLRDEILRAQETLRKQETGRFSSSTAQGGAPAASTLLPGVQETTIEARSSGQVNEGLSRRPLPASSRPTWPPRERSPYCPASTGPTRPAGRAAGRLPPRT